MSKGRIRSGYQRRILDWLSDGGGTVSDISEQLELRMPHASLALRQLRDNGDVIREDQSGIRGAVHRMTTLGLERLQQDSVHRISKYVQQIPPDGEMILLSRDDSTLLFGYVNNAPPPLIHLPDEVNLRELTPPDDSNGNQGGRWAVTRGNSIIWFDIDSLQQVDPPVKTDTGTLVDWSQQSRKIGLVSAKLLENSKPWNITEGTWLKSPIDHSQLPPVLGNGEYVLGLTSDDIEISPPLGIHGHFSSQLLRGLALSTLSKDAIVIGELREFGSMRVLPIELLREWLIHKHPRLDTNRLDEKWNLLQQYYTTNNGSSPSISMKRELLADFGEVEWSENSVQRIELSGVSENGGICIYNWVLSQATQFVGEWNWPIQGNLPLLKRVMASGNCRIIITTKGEFSELTKSNLLLFKGDGMARVNLQIERGIFLPLSLAGNKRTSKSPHSSRLVPANADELNQFLDGGKIENTFSVEKDVETSSQIWKAIDSLPEGDADYANSIERKNPLAAWISSPKQDRLRCWQRISSELENGWADLLPIELCGDELLITASEKAGIAWREDAINHLKSNFIRHNQSIIEVEHLLKDKKTKSFLAAAILLSSETFPLELHEIISDSCKIWLDAPHYSCEVLEAMFPLGKTLDEERMLLAVKCAKASRSHPRDSVLAVWGELLLRLDSGVAISIDLVRKALQILPHTWWSAWSAEWLQMQLSASSSRHWLSENYKPWPALICRPSGENVGLPGHPIKHKGFAIDSESLLHILLLEEGQGKAPLLDLYDAIINAENGNPIHNGRIHPLVGYLTKPVETWPSIPIHILQQGDSEVSALLFGRSFRNRIEQ
ncbi:MAG: ArsR/SmtB family transcription factor [Candidatus Poseidoniales archaeon]